MARGRWIDPEFFVHEELSALGPIAMLVFAGLWTQSDKNGTFQWKPNKLKLAICPFLEFDMAHILAQLESAGFVVKFSSGGECYGNIPKFRKWQHISGKELQSAAKFPEPVGAEPSAVLETSGEEPGKCLGSAQDTTGCVQESQLHITNYSLPITELPITELPPKSPKGDRGRQDFTQGVEVPQQLESIQGFNEAWEARKEQRQSTPKTRYPTEASVRAELKLLESCRDPVAVLNRAVASGWQGLNIQDRDRKEFKPPMRNGHPEEGGRFLN